MSTVQALRLRRTTRDASPPLVVRRCGRDTPSRDRAVARRRERGDREPVEPERRERIASEVDDVGDDVRRVRQEDQPEAAEHRDSHRPCPSSPRVLEKVSRARTGSTRAPGSTRGIRSAERRCTKPHRDERAAAERREDERRESGDPARGARFAFIVSSVRSGSRFTETDGGIGAASRASLHRARARLLRRTIRHIEGSLQSRPSVVLDVLGDELLFDGAGVEQLVGGILALDGVTGEEVGRRLDRRPPADLVRGVRSRSSASSAERYLDLVEHTFVNPLRCCSWNLSARLPSAASAERAISSRNVVYSLPSLSRRT